MPQHTQFGPYALADKLGAGGMGTVFRANAASGEQVALKTLEVADDQLTERLLREIEALAELDHPGIIRIVDYGTQPNAWYAMEVIEGRPLQAYAENPSAPDLADTVVDWWTSTMGSVPSTGDADPFPTGQLIGGGGLPEGGRANFLVMAELGIQLAEALAHLHGQGIVHRDLKPHNVLVDHDGRVVIVDFGLAIWSAGGVGRERLETTHQMAGSLPYMSPEQLRAEWVSARSDLYALGCIFYRLATGKPPFVARNMTRIAMMHLREKPFPLQQERPDLPAEFCQLVMQLLEKDPAKRPSFALDVAYRLSKMLGRKADYEVANLALHRPELAGRETTFAALTRALADRHGDQFVMLTAPSGMGKTRLLNEVSQRLMSKHSLAPRMLAFEQGGDASFTELWPRETFPSGPIMRAAHIEAFLEADSAERDVVVILDDVQWADDEALTAIRYLARAQSGAKWKIVAAYRSDERPEGFEDLDVPQFELAPLDREGMVRLTTSMLGHECPGDLVDYVLRASDGHPFFAAETLRLLVHEGKLRRDFEHERWRIDVLGKSLAEIPFASSLGSLLDKRLDQLSDSAWRLVEVVAVVEFDCSGSLVDRVAPGALEHFAEARHADVLEVDPAGQLRFAHSQLRSAAYRRIDPVRRQQLHGDVADQLGDDLGPARLGHHLRASGQLAEAAFAWDAATENDSATARAQAMRNAIDCRVEGDISLDPEQVLTAGRLLMEVGHFADAEAVLDLVEKGESQTDALLLRAELAWQQAEFDRGLEILDRFEDAFGLDARACLLRAQILRNNSALDDIHECALQGLRVLRPDGSDTIEIPADRHASKLELELLVELAHVMFQRGDAPRAIELLDLIVIAFRGRGDKRSECYALLELIMPVALSGGEIGARETLALRLAQEIEDKRAEARALNLMGNAELIAGNHEAALTWYRRAMALARRMGRLTGGVFVLANSALACSELGRFDEAEDYYRESIKLAKKFEMTDVVINTSTNFGRHLTNVGKFDEALGVLEQTLALADEYGNPRLVGTLLVDLGETCRELERFDEAEAYVTRSIELSHEFGLRQMVWGNISLASLGRDRGDLEMSLEAAQQAVQLASPDSEVERAAAHATRAKALQRLGRNGDEDVVEARAITAEMSGPAFLLKLVSELRLGG